MSVTLQFEAKFGANKKISLSLSITYSLINIHLITTMFLNDLNNDQTLFFSLYFFSEISYYSVSSTEFGAS